MSYYYMYLFCISLLDNNKAMDPELRDLLRATATQPVGDAHTHITLYGPQARWAVRSHNLTAFWAGYCELIDRKMRGRDGIPAVPTANICLAERPQDIMPQVAKLTFRFHAEDNEEQWEPYDDHFLHWLCHTYQLVLSEYFRITTDTQMELIATVCESQDHWFEENPEGQRFMVMEVRIQFPYARVDASMQSRIIRPRVIQLLRNNNILAKMQRQPIGDWEQIITVAAVNEPLSLYGSSEVEERTKLSLTHIWSTINRNMLDGDEVPEEITLVDAFMPQNHTHVQQQSVDMTIFDDKPLSFAIPLFLSTGYWPTVLLPKEEIQDGGRFTTQLRMANSQNESQRVFGDPRARREEIDNTDVELNERMMSFLRPDRFVKESFWLDAGRASYTSNEGSENGLLSWIRHTERAVNGLGNPPAFMLAAQTIPETCRNLYFTFANTPITVKTLAWYAREDSPERYATWHRDWCMSSMEQALSGLNTDVAIALYRVYWLDFTYCAIGKGRWFQFRNHRWNESNQAISLRKAISSDFMKRFEAARMILSRQLHESEDSGLKENGEMTMKKITALIAKLKTTGYKSSLVTEASEQFNNDRFVSLLDTAAEILGIVNGVLEVAGDHVLYRKGKPEDYISMSTSTPYHENLTWNHPLVKECMTWFSQVFTDKSLLHHFLKFAASCLKGRNSDKIFPIMTGEGDNSKSMIVKAFEAVFGMYCIKFDISNVTSKNNNNSSGPSPQLARAKGARLAFMDEPEDDVPMNKGVIKKWIGGDSFFARMLQDNGGDVQVLFKLVLTCNKVPIIPNADRAIKNRTRLFPCMSAWVDNPPEDEAEQYRQRKFKKNPFFERRIPILAPAFLWIMTQYYPYYSAEGLKDPQVVTDHTEAYWRDNDVYAQFAADTIVEVFVKDTNERDANARATLSEIYARFKDWFRDAFPGNKVPERGIVRSELQGRWGAMRGNAWYGIRVIDDAAGGDMNSALGGRKAMSAPGTAPVITERKQAVAVQPKVELVVNKPATPNKLDIPLKPATPNKPDVPLNPDKPASPSMFKKIIEIARPPSPNSPNISNLALKLQIGTDTSKHIDLTTVSI